VHRDDLQPILPGIAHHTQHPAAAFRDGGQPMFQGRFVGLGFGALRAD
jgi:hypothetical protein